MQFYVYGKPQGKGRPRFSNQGGYARAYTPKATSDYEKLIRKAFHEARDKMDYDKTKPISIYIRASFTPPKSISKAKKENLLVLAKPYDKKPDADNIAKVVLDALNGTAYDDDKQITTVCVEKRYSNFDRLKIIIDNED